MFEQRRVGFVHFDEIDEALDAEVREGQDVVITLRLLDPEAEPDVGEVGVASRPDRPEDIGAVFDDVGGVVGFFTIALSSGREGDSERADRRLDAHDGGNDGCLELRVGVANPLGDRARERRR